MAIVLTGASGLLGSHVLKQLAMLNIPVKATYRRLSKQKKIADWLTKLSINQTNINWYEADIMDVFAFDHIIAKGDYIVHCAALVDVLQKNNNRLYQVNTNGTHWLLDCAQKNKAQGFCHISSVAALGVSNDDETLIDESFVFARLKRSSSYAESKFVSESDAWRAAEEGLKVVVVQPTVILGYSPGNYDIINMFSMVKSKWFRSPEGAYGFVGADDVARLVVSIYQKQVYGDSYIANTANLSYLALFQLVTNHLITGKKIQFLSYSRLNFIAKLASFFRLMGFKIPLTSHLVETVSQNRAFSAQKSIDDLGFEYSNIEEVIKEIADEKHR